MKRRKDNDIQRQLDEDKKTSRQFKKFRLSIKRQATAAGYIPNLDNFMIFCKQNSYEKLCNIPPDRLQDLLEDFVMSLSEKSYSYGNVHLAAIFKLLDMNRVVHWKKPLKALLPSNTGKKAGGTPYTTEEIQMMLDVCHDLRARCIILFFASIGCRPGAFQDEDGHLQIKHLKEMPDGCAAVLLYADTSEEYWAFLTPEAYTPMKHYLQYRKEKGEVLTPESGLFGVHNNISPNDYPSKEAINRIITDIIHKAGIKRTIVSFGKNDKPLTYGFRKRLNTILKLDNDVNVNIAEKLMAHKRGLDGTYLKPTLEECFAEFRKAIPELTISKEGQLLVENMKLKAQDDKVTRDKVLQVFDLAESDMDDFKEFMNQKRKDRKYK